MSRRFFEQRFSGGWNPLFLRNLIRLRIATYYGQREGAGKDLELGPAPELAVEIIIFR
jgi:hypothetical protein